MFANQVRAGVPVVHDRVAPSEMAAQGNLAREFGSRILPNGVEGGDMIRKWYPFTGNRSLARSELLQLLGYSLIALSGLHLHQSHTWGVPRSPP